MSGVLAVAKSRQDIIDTSLQQQRELQVLRYLLLLLLLTVGYEYGLPALYESAGSGITEVQPETVKKKILSSKRLERLKIQLEKLARDVPLMRDTTRRHIRLLSDLIEVNPVEGKKASGQLQLAGFLQNLWRELCRPVWGEPRKVSDLKQDVSVLLTFLDRKPADVDEPLFLDFQPKFLRDIHRPNRDIFNYLGGDAAIQIEGARAPSRPAK